MEGPRKVSILHLLAGRYPCLGPRAIWAGTRLTPDSESQENSDLTQIVKRVPGLVFFDVILTYLRLFRDISYFGLRSAPLPI